MKEWNDKDVWQSTELRTRIFYGTQVLNVLDKKEKKSRGKIFAFKIFSAIEDKLSQREINYRNKE